MDVIVLSPTKFLDVFKISDKHLLLAWLVKENKEYREHYAKLNEYKILDNGAFEGRLCDFNELVKLAESINANEIQLPDYLYDFERTLNEAKKVKDLTTSLPFNIHFVVQGKKKEELYKAVDFAVSNEWVVGIPHEPCQLAFRRDFIPREPLIDYIENEYGKEYLKKVHLLGCHDFLEFFSLLYQRCRSMDTTLPVKLGIQRIRLPTLHDVKRPPNYFDIDRLDGEQMDCILFNLRYIQSVLINSGENGKL